MAPDRITADDGAERPTTWRGGVDLPSSFDAASISSAASVRLSSRAASARRTPPSRTPSAGSSSIRASPRGLADVRALLALVAALLDGPGAARSLQQVPAHWASPAGPSRCARPCGPIRSRWPPWSSRSRAPPSPSQGRLRRRHAADRIKPYFASTDSFPEPGGRASAFRSSSDRARQSSYLNEILSRTR